MVRGLVVIILLALNLCLWGLPLLLFSPLKFVTFGQTRRRVILFLVELAERWTGGNNFVFDLMLDTKWDVEGFDGIVYDGHYLIISNHVSWVDIFALFRVFHRKAAFIRFFLKQPLIWFPIAGQACWALEFPFMRRYSADYLVKHPEKRGKDLETTRLACQRYRQIPVAVLNFVEGTRFTQLKRRAQHSPHKHLLKPRIGGISFTLASLGDQLDAMYDVTLVYPQHETTFWEMVTNRVPRIIVRARRVDVPAEFCSESVTVPGPARDHFREWIRGIWREKDALIGKLIEESHERRDPGGAHPDGRADGEASGEGVEGARRVSRSDAR